MRPLKFNFDKEDDLCIWKGNDESIAIYYKDIPSFLGELKELVSGEIDHLFLDRKNWGVLKIEKKNAFYRIYANELEYDCDREDLKRLQNYLSECIEKGSPIFLNDIPPEMDSNKIIIVANELDQPAARLLIDSLAEKYHSKAELWTSDKFFVEEGKIINYKLFISVGGYNYNPVTKKYLDTLEILEQTDEIYIGTAFRKAIIFGYQETESSLNAVKYFIKNNLDGFIKNNFPDLRKENKNKRYWDKPIEKEQSKPTPPNPKPLPDTPKQDQPADPPKQLDPKPEAKTSEAVKEPKAKYSYPIKFKKVFYRSGYRIWTIKYNNEIGNFRESLGIRFIHHILSNPKKNITIEDLFFLAYPPPADEGIDEKQDEIDYRKKQIRVKENAKDKLPLASQGLSNPLDKETIRITIETFKKDIEKKEDKITAIDENIASMEDKLLTAEQEFQSLKIIENRTRNIEGYSIREKEEAKDNVSIKSNLIRSIKDNIAKEKDRVKIIKKQIQDIRIEINRLAVTYNVQTAEKSPEYENVRSSISHNINNFFKVLKKEGFNNLLKYFDQQIDTSNGYTYKETDSDEPWYLKK